MSDKITDNIFYCICAFCKKTVAELFNEGFLYESLDKQFIVLNEPADLLMHIE